MLLIRTFLYKKTIERLYNPTKLAHEVLYYYLTPSKTICDIIKSYSVSLICYLGSIRFFKNVDNKIIFNKLIMEFNWSSYLNKIYEIHFLKGDQNIGQFSTR